MELENVKKMNAWAEIAIQYATIRISICFVVATNAQYFGRFMCLFICLVVYFLVWLFFRGNDCHCHGEQGEEGVRRRYASSFLITLQHSRLDTSTRGR